MSEGIVSGATGASDTNSDSIGTVSIGEAPSQAFTVGTGQPLAFICGPCVIESREHLLRMGDELARIRDAEAVPMIFKSSFDKANRTSSASFRGVGSDEGLRLLAEIRATFGFPIVTDVHTTDEARAAGEVVDLIQIPAFLSRQTDLLIAAGETGRPVMIKKGQFLHPRDMRYAATKAAAAGAAGVLLCERGTCFGYRDLVVDMRSLSMMAESGFPVVFDGTHSVQQIGGSGDGRSGGNREYVSSLARAAVAVGVNAVFLEAHDDPEHAPSDGPNMIPIAQLASLLRDLVMLDQLPLTTRVISS